MKKITIFAGLVCVLAMVLPGCTSYKRQEVGFRPPAAYSGMQVVAGAQIAAQGFAEKRAAKDAFGFDIREAGLLPVQVVVDNQGGSRLSVVPEQTFLVDATGNYWNLLDQRSAYQRLERSSEYARIAKGAGRTSVIGAAGGAIVGAAIGVLSGENVGTAMGKGAAVGAAGGAVIGGAEEADSRQAGREISKDLAVKQLENRAIEPGTLAHGFLFFPGEAPSASVLRLQMKELGSGRLHTVTLTLE